MHELAQRRSFEWAGDPCKMLWVLRIDSLEKLFFEILRNQSSTKRNLQIAFLTVSLEISSKNWLSNFLHSLPTKISEWRKETRFKIRSDIFFLRFSSCPPRQKLNKEKRATMKWSCRNWIFKLPSGESENANGFVFHRRSFKKPTNDSLTRVNVKSILRWLNLWNVLLDGMLGVVDVHAVASRSHQIKIAQMIFSHFLMLIVEISL